MQKLCTKCQERKRHDEFHKSKSSKDGLQKWCKECLKLAMRQSYRNTESNQRTRDRIKSRIDNLRKQVDSIKVMYGCCLCNEKSGCCLDLHHTDETDKVDSVANLVAKKSATLINTELKKCVILCANCHRKVHAGELQVATQAGYIIGVVV